ncbi:MAG TPA: SDR family NAD(P)-dependent oxidoreductase, partial [Pseudolysinimonas sp.]|nr:SDR family NAD(P)-dependent oxidoreductase [Pseudolysinimonas sp.]
MSGRMDGHVAVVTGAGAKSGIGYATALRLAEEGALVTATDVALDPSFTEPQVDGRLRFAQHDATDESAWQSVLDDAKKAHGNATVLVNNAGIIKWNVPILEMSVADFRRTVDVNVTSMFLGMKSVVPQMVEAGHGSII